METRMTFDSYPSGGRGQLMGDQRRKDDLDLAIALSLQDQCEREEVSVVRRSPVAPTNCKGIVDEHWELADPNPNIHQLYVEFDSLFFWSKLTASGVAVDWSTRMTLCAGVCSYEGRGGFCSVRLSQPLLALRPRRDLVETLLHEMIHAYLFVTHNYKDHDGHGPKFLSHMHRINKATGAKITVFHTFHQEVKQYRQHWWKCDGSCQTRPPYFGVVRRAVNRPPSPRDPWWLEHQRTCGGKYTKIKEPEGYGRKCKNRNGGGGRGKGKAGGNRDIRELLGGKGKPSEGETSRVESSSGESSKQESSSVVAGSKRLEPEASVTAFGGRGFVLGKRSGQESGSSEVDLRGKMLAAAEKRKFENERKLAVKSKRKQNSNSSRDFDVAIVTTKKPRLDNTSMGHSPRPPVNKPKPQSPLRKATPPIIVLDDDEPSPPADVVCVENEIDLVNSTPLPEEWFENVDDYKVCPVCGMSNIPSAIINIHVSLCLEVEEESRIVDQE